MKLNVLLLAGLLGATSGGIRAAGMPAQTPAQPSGAIQQTATPGVAAPPSDSAPMSKAEVLALLYKIYDRAYHFGDTVSKLPAGDWKFGGRKRQLFYDKAATARAGVTALRKPWDDFYKQPDDPALGRATLSAIQSLTAQMNDFMAALGDTPGASQVADFKPMATDLADWEHQLEPYVTYLQAAAQPPASAQPKTSGVTASTSGATPPASAAVAPAPPPPPSNPPASAETSAAQHAPAAPSAVAASPSAQPGAEAPPSTSASAPNTAAPPSATQPAPTSEAAAPQPAVTPVAMPPADVQALLYKIYVASFRIGDLAGSLQPDKWTLSSEDQTAFAAKLDALRAALAAAEKSRGDFYNHPEDAELGRATGSALQAVTPKLDDFLAALSSTPGSAEAPDFKTAESDLTTLDQRLDPYVAYLAEKAQPAAPAGGAGIETEVVKTPESVAPMKTAIVESAPQDQEQVKAILYKAYIPAFRLKDMLAQEHPDQWHAAQADRTSFADAAKALSDRLDELAKWRDQLDSHPDSLEAAFEAYASLGKVVGPADVVGRLVGQYGNAKMGAEYGQRAEQVDESRDELEPYLDYLLRHHDHTVGAIERDFVSCETQLSYAMRPNVQQPVVMKNINPVFQGRGKRTARGGHPETTRKSRADDQKKKSTSPPAPASKH